MSLHDLMLAYTILATRPLEYLTSAFFFSVDNSNFIDSQSSFAMLVQNFVEER